MNFWDLITGADISKQMNVFESRAKKLPAEYQAAWEDIKKNIWPHTNMSGRNLIPIFDGVLGLLEETAAEGKSVKEALGEDIKGFCMALTREEGSYRDKCREQLNCNVAQKLGRQRVKP